MAPAILKQVLTDRTLKALKPALTGKRTMIWDATTPHFAVRVTDKGRRTFLVVRRRPGDPRLLYHALGTYPAMTLAEARGAARAALASIAEGIHPKEVAAEHRREHDRRKRDTFAAAIEVFVADERSRGLRTADETAALLRREFLGQVREKQDGTTAWVNGPAPLWRDRPVSEITRRDIIARLDEIKRRGGKHAARHALSAIRKFFNWCAEGEQFGIEVSPAIAIRDKTIGITGRDLKRKRVLDDVELRDVWRAAEGLGAYGSVVRLLMLLGQRLSDIAGARWGEIDLDTAVLTVPPERYKTGVGQVVPLPPRAVAILCALPHFMGPYIFTTTGGEKPITPGSKLKERLDRAIAEQRKTDGREAMQPWTIHDIRRSVRTRLVGDCGVEAFIAERVIGHTLPGLHGVYDQGTHMTAKADALARWERRLLAIVEPGEPAAAGPVIPPEELVRRRKGRRP